MGRNKQIDGKSNGDRKEKDRILSFLVYKPEQSYDRIDHCDRQDNECCKSKFKHRVGTQISAGIDIPYIEDLRCDKKHESDDGHTAAEYIYDITLCKEGLYGIGKN